jgi:hypothetical protein
MAGRGPDEGGRKPAGSVPAGAGLRLRKHGPGVKSRRQMSPDGASLSGYGAPEGGGLRRIVLAQTSQACLRRRSRIAECPRRPARHSPHFFRKTYPASQTTGAMMFGCLKCAPRTRFTLPWRGRVGEHRAPARCETGWGENESAKARTTMALSPHPACSRFAQAGDPPPPGEGEETTPSPRRGCA